MKFDHPAKMMTAPDIEARVCSVCGGPVNGGRRELRHVGEAVPRQVVPARADVSAVNRAAAVAEQALAGLVWTPHLRDADRAQVVVDALYAAGLLAQRPRSVRPRRVRACVTVPAIPGL